MFASKKELDRVKKELEKLSKAYVELSDVVFFQQQEINELKKPKEPEYFG